ncbi:MAG: exonuclease SbcCD subunit D [Acidimicrobiales bacterium]|nr:exonuclease SbcCD subunit D [Acidimicrobiales bacterium]
MKILHTSDWHLGRSFHGASLLDEQAEALDRIARIVEQEEVELVVVAGDLFDRAIPPAPAVELLGATLNRFHAAGAAVAAISGNHDSAVRVGGNDALLNLLGVALRGDHRRVAEPLVLERPADGGPPVAVYLIPYLEPVAVAADLSVAVAPNEIAPDTSAVPTLFDHLDSDRAADSGRTGGRSHRPTQDLVTRAAVARIREDIVRRGSVRSVVVAHTFVAGGEVSDSERDLSVGNLERVSLSTFDGFDMVALGHLHSPQRLAGERIAYAGSPLPYSFSEEGQTKSVRMVELAPSGEVTATLVPLSVGRPVRTIVGDLADLLVDPALADAESARVRVRLTDADLPNSAMARLRIRFPYAVELRHEPGGSMPVAGDDFVATGDIRRLEPLDLALRFWQEQEGSEADSSERDLLALALDAAVREAAS